MEGRALEEVKGCNFGFTREKGNGKGNEVNEVKRSKKKTQMVWNKVTS